MFLLRKCILVCIYTYGTGQTTHTIHMACTGCSVCTVHLQWKCVVCVGGGNPAHVSETLDRWMKTDFHLGFLQELSQDIYKFKVVHVECTKVVQTGLLNSSRYEFSTWILLVI